MSARHSENRGRRRRNDLFGTGGARPIELYRRGEAVALLDVTSDLRCAAGPEDTVAQLTAFDRAGVLVRLTAQAAMLRCSIAHLDDVMRGIRHVPLELWSDDVRGWAAVLVQHSVPEFMYADTAGGVVRAELSTYEHVRLEVPPQNLGIFEAPRSVMNAGHLIALALRAAGCPLGPQVRERPAVEHPDLYLD